MSAPARVDLSAIVPGAEASSIRELSLTANQYRDEMRPCLAWNVDGPIGPGGGNDTKSSSFKSGFKATMWVAGDKAAGSGHGRSSSDRGSGVGGSAAGEGGSSGFGNNDGAFNVWRHDDDAPPLFTLFPMEIRTFQVRLLPQPRATPAAA